MRYAIVFVVLLLTVALSHAQETPPDGPPPLDFAQTRMVYYEDDSPNQIGVLLLRNNVCPERFAALNPHLTYDNIPYGTRVILPWNEPCYAYEPGFDASYSWSRGSPKRLKYYEGGRWLAEPYYSEEVEYIYLPSVEAVASHFNICLDVLLAHNILLQRYKIEALTQFVTLDVFIPDDALPCDPQLPAPVQQAPQYTSVELKRLDLLPEAFVTRFNVCPEELRTLEFALYGQQYDNRPLRVALPLDARPCYNADRQRLQYFSRAGLRKARPTYSDLPVVRAEYNDTLMEIASKHGVCIVDLLRINGFPSLPVMRSYIELFVPPPRPCPDDLDVRRMEMNWTLVSTDMLGASLETNVCIEDLAPLNPHLGSSNRDYPLRDRNSGVWVIVPRDAEPCYRTYRADRDAPVYVTERDINVCIEATIRPIYYGNDPALIDGRAILFARRDTPRCYNDAGTRLEYEDEFSATLPPPVVSYPSHRFHIVEPDDTVYSISQEYDVCVHDLLRENPRLKAGTPTGLHAIIPDTRPCYDAATGMPLVYEDEDGNALPEPVVGDHLVYYGSQPLGHVSRYYNVCENRIADANEAKLSGRRWYLGWIIPTDRPPCYDAEGAPLRYACYHQPVDMAKDYWGDPVALFPDMDAPYCYNVKEPDTVIWVGNRRYAIVSVWRSPHRASNLAGEGFAEWCLGVSMTGVRALNDDPNIAVMLVPFAERLVPQPTRDCYLLHPELHEGKRIYTVQDGDTLSAIAARYDVPYQLIAAANGLDADNTIWPRQDLIIPTWPTWREVKLAGVGAAALLGLVSLWLLRRRRTSGALAPTPLV